MPLLMQKSIWRLAIMNEQDKISIIVPIYNAEIYLERCITSIVGQTYSDLEILLIDDGSTDKSPFICDAWAEKDKRIRVIHQVNEGVSSSRNKGLNNVSGAYLMMVDSDDYISENAVEYMLRAAIAEKADIVICDFEKGNHDDWAFTCSEKEAKTENAEEVFLKIYENDHNKLRFVVPWCKLYKTELFLGVRYPERRIFEDIYTTHHLIFKSDRITLLDQKLWYYYQHKDSIMSQPFHIGKLDYLEALSDRVDFFREKGIEKLEQHAYDELLHSLIWEYSRARDMLHLDSAKSEIVRLYREYYNKSYSSIDYPSDTRRFLAGFARWPELVMWYWKLEKRMPFLRRIMGRK